MKTVTVYDPAMCCSSGICGPSVDPDLVNLAALLKELRSGGLAATHRYGLSSHPLKFAEEPIRSLLERRGDAALPALFVDGELFLSGHYPGEIERQMLRLRLAQGES
ncbi:MAG: arsenite efflux transporter metallochaperone ArsD [Verrucomicrobiota bacterium]|jgi:hypothetical protein